MHSDPAKTVDGGHGQDSNWCTEQDVLITILVPPSFHNWITDVFGVVFEDFSETPTSSESRGPTAIRSDLVQ